MEIAETIDKIKSLTRAMSGSVGFVPTMGFLHEGHLSLVRKAREENDVVVVSIFVNPTQFGKNEDFGSYPRNFKQDIEMLQKEQTDIVFFPSAVEMYPDGFDSWVEVKQVTDHLEGICRPGHFQGVTTVVAKLFNIVEPDRAYFGQKDAQQAIVIQKMVRDLNMNLDVIVLPTCRESDGLAMSSRNTYLTPEERNIAAVLFRALTLSRALYEKGEKDAAFIRQEMQKMIEKEKFTFVEYISIADERTLEELTEITPPALVSLAVKVGKTRLIDNIVLK
jgi:pantoate--beta-alanine ligase